MLYFLMSAQIIECSKYIRVYRNSLKHLRKEKLSSAHFHFITPISNIQKSLLFSFVLFSVYE
jgi:hypothetical protein